MRVDFGFIRRPGAKHLRDFAVELGNHIGGRHLIDEAQEAKLKATLQHIVEHPSQSMGVRR